MKYVDKQNCELCIENQTFQLRHYLTWTPKYYAIFYPQNRSPFLATLSTELMAHKNLRSLVLDGENETLQRLKWTEESTEVFARTIKYYPGLKSFTLTMNFSQSLKGSLGFLNCISGNSIRLLNIKVSGVTLNEYLDGLGQRLITRDNLQVICIELNGLESRTAISATRFCQGITRQKDLRQLSLTQGNLGHITKELAKALSHSVCLETLSLNSRNNRLVLSYICSALQSHATLSVLDLSNSKLEDEDCIALSKLLPTLKELRVLILKNTQITQSSLQLILNTLSQHKLALAELDLSENSQVKQLIAAVADFINNNTVLRMVRLRKCHLEEEQLAQLFPVLNNSKTCRLGLC